MRNARLGLVLLLFGWQTGCQYLFPEFNTPAADLSDTDAGDAGTGAQTLSGRVCNLTDVRDYRTCPALAGSYRISVEETRDSVTTDAGGAFTLVTSANLTLATVGVSDPLGQRVSTVVRVRLTATGTTQVTLPSVSTAAMQQLALNAGAPTDPTRGMMLAYLVNDSGLPVAGVISARIVNATGPLYDGAAPNELVDAKATSQGGTVAFFDLPAGQLTLPVSPPAAFLADTFVLPIRSNAVTISALVLRAQP